MYGLHYTVDHTTYLDNGDEITITVRPTDYTAFDSDYAARYEQVPSRTSVTMNVEGVTEYVDTIENISDDALLEMQDAAEGYWKNLTGDMQDSDRVKNYRPYIEYQGMYLLKARARENSVQNRVYLVYKEVLNGEFYYAYEQYQDESIERYWYCSFNNFVLNSDGTYEVDLTDITCTVSYGEEDTTSFSIQEGERSYNILGYRTLEGIFNKCIIPQTAEYTYESTLSEADGTLETTAQQGYTPSDLTYMSSLEELSEAKLEKIKEYVETDQAQRTNKANTEGDYVRNFSVQSEYIGMYFLNGKTKHETQQNMLYVVYKEEINAEYYCYVQWVGDLWQEEDITRYVYWRYDDVQILPDGTCILDPEAYTYVGTDETIGESERFTFKEGMGDRERSYTYEGYRTLDGMYKNCVAANLLEYTYDTTIPSEEDGSTEETAGLTIGASDITYLESLEELPETKLEKVKEYVEADQAQRTNKGNTEGASIHNFTASSEYVGMYLLKGKKNHTTPQNMLYVVYKEEINAEYYCYADWVGDVWQEEDITRYIYWRYDDIQILPDGTCILDPGAYIYVGSDEALLEAEQFTIEEGMGDRKRSYAYAGYRTLDGLYKNCVAANLLEYTYDTTIPSEEDGSTEETAGLTVGASDITYLDSLEELPEEKLEKIKEYVEADQAQRTNKANTENNHIRNFTAKAEYVGMYLLNGKKNHINPQNMLYVVYKEEISAEYYYYDNGEQWQAEDITRYIYWRYDDVQMLPDGTCILDPDAFTYVGAENEVYSFSEGDNEYSYEGFLSLDTFISECIASKMEEYDVSSELM